MRILKKIEYTKSYLQARERCAKLRRILDKDEDNSRARKELLQVLGEIEVAHAALASELGVYLLENMQGAYLAEIRRLSRTSG